MYSNLLNLFIEHVIFKESLTSQCNLFSCNIEIVRSLILFIFQKIPFIVSIGGLTSRRKKLIEKNLGDIKLYAV